MIEVEMVCKGILLFIGGFIGINILLFLVDRVIDRIDKLD